MSQVSTLNFFDPSILNSQISTVADQVSSDLNGEMVILHVKTGAYYGLNEVGTQVWDLLQKTTTPAIVRDTVLSEYDVEQQQLEKDLQVLFSGLYEKGLIEIDHEAAA